MSETITKVFKLYLKSFKTNKKDSFAMVKIQNMKPSDWEEVSLLHTLAFNGYNNKTGCELSTYYRSRANVDACLAMLPDGCFVAKSDHLLGYIFSRY